MYSKHRPFLYFFADTTSGWPHTVEISFVPNQPQQSSRDGRFSYQNCKLACIPKIPARPRRGLDNICTSTSTSKHEGFANTQPRNSTPPVKIAHSSPSALPPPLNHPSPPSAAPLNHRTSGSLGRGAPRCRKPGPDDCVSENLRRMCSHLLMRPSGPTANGLLPFSVPSPARSPRRSTCPRQTGRGQQCRKGVCLRCRAPCGSGDTMIHRGARRGQH